MNVMKEYLRMLCSLFKCLFDFKCIITKLSTGFYYLIPAGTAQINPRLKPALKRPDSLEKQRLIDRLPLGFIAAEKSDYLPFRYFIVTKIYRPLTRT
jgi:hypothetical protein